MIRVIMSLILIVPVFNASAEVSSGSGADQGTTARVAQKTDGQNYSVRHYDAILNPNPKKRQASADCDLFIDNNGNFGTYGEELIRTTRNADFKACFYEKIDFSYLCPNYSSFREEKKSQFLAFMFASMATYESACRKSSSAQGVNGRADGLFMLEYSQSQRRAAGRDPKYCATNESVDTQGVTFQMQCAVSIFSKSHCGTGTKPGKNSSDYWQKLRPGSNGSDRAITAMAKKFPGCGN